jgi:hypothetical protein
MIGAHARRELRQRFGGQLANASAMSERLLHIDLGE